MRFSRTLKIRSDERFLELADFEKRHSFGWELLAGPWWNFLSYFLDQNLDTLRPWRVLFPQLHVTQRLSVIPLVLFQNGQPGDDLDHNVFVGLLFRPFTRLPVTQGQLP